MSKLAITAIAGLVMSCLLAGSAFAAPLAGVNNSLALSAAWKCGGCKQSCCEKKCCKPKQCCEKKCCKPKCCKPKCCEPCCKKKCCPVMPEYPNACPHAHGDLERDLSSRAHAG